MGPLRLYVGKGRQDPWFIFRFLLPGQFQPPRLPLAGKFCHLWFSYLEIFVTYGSASWKFFATQGFATWKFCNIIFCFLEFYHLVYCLKIIFAFWILCKQPNILYFATWKKNCHLIFRYLELILPPYISLRGNYFCNLLFRYLKIIFVTLLYISIPGSQFYHLIFSDLEISVATLQLISQFHTSHFDASTTCTVLKLKKFATRK